MDTKPFYEEKTGKKICFQDGKLYFTRSGERFFFLIMTIVMAAVGIIHLLNLP